MSTPWVNEETPERVAVGATLPFQMAFDGISSASNPTSTWYKNDVDVTADVASGADTASGNSVTLKAFTPRAEDVGSEVICSLAVTLDGVIDVVKMRFQVESAH